MSDRDPYVMSEGEARTLQQLLRKSAPFLGGDTFGHSSSSHRAFPARVKSIETGKGAPNIDEEGTLEMGGDGEPVRDEADYLVCRQVDLEKQTDQTGDITVAPAFGGSAGDYAVGDDVMILHGVTGWRDLDGKPVMHREVGRASSSGLIMGKLANISFSSGTNPDGDPEKFLNVNGWDPTTQGFNGTSFRAAPMLGTSATEELYYKEDELFFFQSFATGWLDDNDDPINHIVTGGATVERQLFPANRYSGSSPFIVPDNVTLLMIIAHGAGGGGAASQDNEEVSFQDSTGGEVILNTRGAGGGGGGQGGKVVAIARVFPGQEFNFTIGVGGLGGSKNPPDNPDDGSDTNVDAVIDGVGNNIQILARGGDGGRIGEGGDGAGFGLSNGTTLLIENNWGGMGGQDGSQTSLEILGNGTHLGRGGGVVNRIKNTGKGGDGGVSFGENGEDGSVEFIW